MFSVVAYPQDLADWLGKQVATDEASTLSGECRCEDGQPTRPDCGDRILADCDAKQDLIEWALGIEHLRDVEDPDAPVHPLGLQVLQMLAKPYQDRDGFREEWRPEP